jgi:LysW-gamma-L-lysine carboxypeptidase
MQDDLLVELVRRYSPSQQEGEAVNYLVEWMAAHGFDARVDEVGNACGIRGSVDAPNTLMLLGHIDTFPGEIDVRIDNDVLYGRGSVDAKGSLCTFAEAAAQATIPNGWRVVVVGAVEEEIATSKGAHYIAQQFEPTMCIIGEPSGVSKITLGYKGRLLIDYRLTRPVAHTARPEPSVGALGAAFWSKIEAWAETKNVGVEGQFDRVTPHLRSINTQSDNFHDTLTMTVSFRLPPSITPEATFEAVRGFAEPDGELCPYGLEHAIRSDRSNGLVRSMLAAMRSNRLQPGFVLKTGTSDMNVVGRRWNCPIIAYGPGDSNLDHTPDEHLPLAEYQRAVAVLRSLIDNLPDQP